MRILLALAVALLVIPVSTQVPKTVAAATPHTFTNPLTPGTPTGAADPYILRYGGNYYFTGTAGCQGGYICVWKSATITGLGTAQKYNVFPIPPCPAPNCKDIWAPEIHYIRGHFYIYYAATSGPAAQRRVFVLADTSTDPVGTYVEANTGYPGGELHEASDLWAIDPDVFTTADGALYVVWAGWPGPVTTGVQNIYIAPMSDPLHLSGPRVLISSPTRPWETVGTPLVNEGPVGFQHGGRTFITYSASFCGTDSYSVGLLTNSDGNLLDPNTWTKTGPIFAEHSGVKGPASFVPITSPGGEDWFLVHSNTVGCGPGRVIRAQRLYWDTNGMPLLGYPIADGVPIVAPAGELGSTGSPDPFSDGWGNAFGDASEGDRVDGVQSGRWRISSPTSAMVTAPEETAQLFQAGNPNYETYSVEATVRWLGAAAGDSRYGVYACYSDHLNYVESFIDPRSGELLTDAVVQGVDAGRQATPLPAGFDPRQAHTIVVRKVGATFTFSVDGSTQQQRTFDGTAPVLLSGQVGLVTQNSVATYQDVRVFDTL